MGLEEKERLTKKIVLDEIENALRNVEAEKEEKKRNAGRLALEQEILDNLAVLGGKTFSEDAIERGGSKIRLPENMTYKQGAKYLLNQEEAEESITNYHRTFNYLPWDGAFCAAAALKRVFGSVAHTGNRGWFGMSPPDMITIPSGVGTTVQVPWGSFELPFLPGVEFHSGSFQHSEKGMLYALSVEGPRKWRSEIEGIFNAIENELQTNSLYRGKAFDGQETPEFIDVFSVDPAKVVYSQEVMTKLGESIWARIQYPHQFLRRGIKFKRAVLIHGPFGTGKTLACLLTGQIASNHGVTFIKARPGRDQIGVVLQRARLYSPAIVCYEDIDGTASAEDTDRTAMSKLLDDFDGIEAKGSDVMMVLTTNYPERIHKGMTRPGRIDDFIEISDLDQKGVENLVRSRIEEDLEPDIDWAAVFEAAEGYKPAFVTEGAERTVGFAINEFGDEVDGHQISTQHLVDAMRGMRSQYNRMMGAKDTQTIDPLGLALRREIGVELSDTVPQIIDSVMSDRGM